MSQTVSRRRTCVLSCCTTCRQVSPLIRQTAEVIVISAQVRRISEGKMGPSGHERWGKCYIPSALHRYAVCVLTSPLPLRLPPPCLCRPGLFSYRLRPSAPAADYMNYLQCVNPPQLLFVFAPPRSLNQVKAEGVFIFFSLPPLSVILTTLSPLLPVTHFLFLRLGLGFVSPSVCSLPLSNYSPVSSQGFACPYVRSGSMVLIFL